MDGWFRRWFPFEKSERGGPWPQVPDPSHDAMSSPARLEPSVLRSPWSHLVCPWYVLVLGVLGLIQLVAQRNNQTWRSTNPSSDDLSVFTFNQYQSITSGTKGYKRGTRVVPTSFRAYRASEHFGTSIFDRTIAVSSWEPSNPSNSVIQSFQYVGTLRKSNEMGNPYTLAVEW